MNGEKLFAIVKCEANDMELDYSKNFDSMENVNDCTGMRMTVFAEDEYEDINTTLTKNKKTIREFIKRMKELGIKTSKVKTDDDGWAFVDVNYDDNKDSESIGYLKVIRECKTTITFTVLGKKFRLKKKGFFDGSDRYTLINGILYWDKNFRITDGMAVSVNKGVVSDEDESDLVDQSRAKDVLTVKFPTLREMLESDYWCDIMTAYEGQIGGFGSSPDDGLREFYEEFSDWLEGQDDMVLLFEGIFFGNEGEWFVNGDPVKLG